MAEQGAGRLGKQPFESFKENGYGATERRVARSVPVSSRIAHDLTAEDRRMSRLAFLFENLSELLFFGAALFLSIAAFLFIFSLRYVDAGGGIYENVVLTLALSGISMAGLSMTLGWTGSKCRTTVYQVKTPLSANAKNYSPDRPTPSPIGRPLMGSSVDRAVLVHSRRRSTGIYQPQR